MSADTSSLYKSRKVSVRLQQSQRVPYILDWSLTVSRNDCLSISVSTSYCQSVEVTTCLHLSGLNLKSGVVTVSL